MKSAWNRLIHPSDTFNDIPIIRSIQNSFIHIIPIVLIGSLATILQSLPIASYHSMMTGLFGEHWNDVLQFVVDGSFDAVSLIMVVSTSYAYIQEHNNRRNASLTILAPMVALGSYVLMLGIDSSSFEISDFSETGLFYALIISLSATIIFKKLCDIKPLRIRAVFDGANPNFSNAISLIIPAVLTITLFAVINEIITYHLGIENIQSLIIKEVSAIFFQIDSAFWRGIVYVMFIHLFWFFGMHGSNMLAAANENVYDVAFLNNQNLHMSGLPPTEIFTKPFWDSFILMGGCGAVICLVLAILLAGRNTSQRRLAKISIFPVVFNTSELIVYGLPVVLNPVFFIPFFFVPILLASVSYLATSLGLVPYTVHNIEWTTPILLSGYISTGSIAGSALQLFNLMLGTLCYVPFVRRSTRLLEKRKSQNLQKLNEALQKNEASGKLSVLTYRMDVVGGIARSLSEYLERDIAKESVDLYYQPIVGPDGKMVYAEALLRWKNSDYGFISPPLAITLASETDMIGSLGEYIFRRVFKDIAKLKASGITGIAVSINVTAAQIRDDHFVDRLEELMAAYQIHRSDIIIEITEEESLSHSKRIARQIQLMNQDHLRIAMDDFGAGHTSLMYLQEYRFYAVKLDGSLVHDVVTNQKSREIISAILALGKTMNYRVVAEFVETEEQMRTLKELGCEMYQGYLYSKALPIDELIQYAGDRRES